MKNARIGDIVYEYGTGHEFTIEKFIDSDIEDIYKIEYNDGRITFCRESELRLYKNMDVFPYYINYNKDRVINLLTPDPYIAGALLIYGDSSDEYVNLPFDSDAVNNLFSHKYQLNYGNKLSLDGKLYFTYNGDSVDKLITWKEFFPNNYTFFAKFKDDKHPLVPLEYQRASINNRKQFIRGVFDVGYNKEVFPDTCGILHEKMDNLLEVQKILWSLGILSIVTYNTNLPVTCKGKNYRLEVVGGYDGYPGFFYNIDSIERMIIHGKHSGGTNFKLQIKSVEWYSKTYMRNILLRKPYVHYLMDNFLPRISELK